MGLSFFKRDPVFVCER